MGYFLDSTIELLKKSVNLTLWGYYLLIGLIIAVLAIISLIVIAIPAIITIIYLPFDLTAIIIYAVLGVIAVLVLVFLGALGGGIYINFAREYLEKGSTDLGLAWNRTIPRAFTAFKVQLILSIVVLTAMILWMIPLILSFMSFIEQNQNAIIFSAANELFGDFFSTSSFTQIFLPFLITSLLWVLLGFLIYFLISLALRPMLVLLETIPYFEKIGAIDCFKRAYFLGRKNYSNNYFFIIWWVLLTFAVSIPYIIIISVLSAFETLGTQTTVLIGFFIIAIILRVIIQVIYGLWSTAFSSFVSVTIYKFDAVTPTPSPQKRKTSSPAKPKTSSSPENPWATMKKKKRINNY
ncbi:MAG: hypothetical protein ABIE23_04960 [archaeon]